MTDAFSAFPTLEMALNHRYRGHDGRDWQEWNDRHAYASVAAIPETVEKALLRRDAGNATGLGERQGLRHLIAGHVDQAMLEEIGTLQRLERLELEWPTLADDLAPLRHLPNLQYLSVDSPRNVTAFDLLAKLPSLRTLIVTNARHMTDIAWLGSANHLRVIGIEGAMDRKQVIASLAPLAGLTGLEAFLGTSLRLLDPDLMPLARCLRLQFIGIARVAKKPAFDALREARPDVSCSWFADSMWRKPGLRAA